MTKSKKKAICFCKKNIKYIPKREREYNKLTTDTFKLFFLNNSKVRLLNSAENEFGRVSKSILDRKNTILWNLIKVNQRKDTSEVIESFKNIGKKQKYKLILSYIRDFYPTITKDMLTKSLKFAEENVQISGNHK